MNDYLVYLDLPKVPIELIEPIDTIINLPPKSYSNVPSDFQYFQTRNVSKELFEWVQDTLGVRCYTQYQIVRRGVPIHKDIGRNVAFNYLLQTGGSKVLTTFHDDTKRLITYEQIKPMSWHRLRTDVYHCIMGLTTDRVAISVDIEEYKWNDAVSFERPWRD